MKRYATFPKTAASPSDCLVSYPNTLIGELYGFAEKQSVDSPAIADWAIGHSLQSVEMQSVYSTAEMQSVYSTAPVDWANSLGEFYLSADMHLVYSTVPAD